MKKEPAHADSFFALLICFWSVKSEFRKSGQFRVE